MLEETRLGGGVEAGESKAGGDKAGSRRGAPEAALLLHVTIKLGSQEDGEIKKAKPLSHGLYNFLAHVGMFCSHC